MAGTKRSRSVSPTTKRIRNEKATAKRRAQGVRPKGEVGVKNKPIYDALSVTKNGQHSKRFAAAAANAHPNLTGDARKAYIRKKKFQEEIPEVLDASQKGKLPKNWKSIKKYQKK